MKSEELSAWFWERLPLPVTVMSFIFAITNDVRWHRLGIAELTGILLGLFVPKLLWTTFTRLPGVELVLQRQLLDLRNESLQHLHKAHTDGLMQGLEEGAKLNADIARRWKAAAYNWCGRWFASCDADQVRALQHDITSYGDWVCDTCHGCGAAPATKPSEVDYVQCETCLGSGRIFPPWVRAKLIRLDTDAAPLEVREDK